MRDFAALLDQLIFSPSRNAKLAIMKRYFAETSDPDRGYGLAAITRDLDIPTVKPAMLRELVTDRIDPELFRHSYHYVGDLAETIALVWPVESESSSAPRLSEIVDTLRFASKSDALRQVGLWLDMMKTAERFALVKLLTGGLRVGVSARLAKQALAQFGNVDVSEIEVLWHGIDHPYTDLFAWLEGRAEKPVPKETAIFSPVMLAHPLGDGDLAKLSPEDFAAEWKWDGIRVQAANSNGVRKLFSRSGDDISRSFPDIVKAMNHPGVFDGELLVAKPGKTSKIIAATFADLQKRLNRKTVSKPLLAKHPAFIRIYDVLHDGTNDLRPKAFSERRMQLEKLSLELNPERFDISPLVSFDGFDQLESMRASPPSPVVEGLMLKRWDSIYVPGRPKGEWFKWKKDPHNIDAVLMYAQRGHGKRSGYYSDYTFGVWYIAEDGARSLVPVGKAYFGFTDDELKQIDKHVRDNTVERFGPVRSVRAEPDHGLVFEVAFEGLNLSTRHKSGVAMRFPRISRIRWDKKPIDADTLDGLKELLPE